MKKIPIEYIEYLESQGYERTFPKKDARILFTTLDFELKDILVEEFRQPIDHMELYEIYKSDFGNCLQNWDNWSLVDVLLKCFRDNMTYEVKRKVLFELSKVQEWRPELAEWIYKNYY